MATIKQKIAFKEVVKGSTLTKAMSIAGYSPTTAARTNKLTATDGWKELMDKYIPDKELAKKHRELLNKKERIYVEGTLVSEEPETQAVSKALEMGYKLKGKYNDSEQTGNKTLIINITGQTNERYGIRTNTITSNSSD